MRKFLGLPLVLALMFGFATMVAGCGSMVDECSTNDDCEDGVFCNGEETCNFDSGPNAMVCRPAVVQDACIGANLTCDEALDMCIAN